MNEEKIVPVQPNARLERIRYDGFRAFLMGRAPTEALAQAFARQLVARGEQARYGYDDDQTAATIAHDLGYWVLKPHAPGHSRGGTAR